MVIGAARGARDGSGRMAIYMVDTSVWVDHLRERETRGTANSAGALDTGLSFGLTGVVYQEVF